MGCCLWFTGLSGSGKSTLANALMQKLKVLKVTLERTSNIEILDGDEIRTNLSKGLGFSKEDRDINVKRIGYVAKLLARNDVTVIVASISPYSEVRDFLKSDIDNFVEIYCECPMDVLHERDPKGLYQKVKDGTLKNFTGVDDPYEAPVNPDVYIRTDLMTVDESVAMVLRFLLDSDLV